MTQRRWIGVAFWGVVVVTALASGLFSSPTRGDADGSGEAVRIGEFETQVGDVGMTARLAGFDETSLVDAAGWNQVGDSVFAQLPNDEWVKWGTLPR